MNPRAPLPPDFLLQAEDLIARLDADLALLRRISQEQSRAVYSERRKIVGRLFHSTHTLKGAAATFDEHVTARLAHEIENTLHVLRLASRTPLAASLCEALQAAVDTISVHLRGRAETGNTGDEEHRHRAEIEAAIDKVIVELQTCTGELQAMGESQEADAARGAGETAADVSALRREELPAEWQDAPLDAATIAHLRDAAQDELNLFSLVFSFNLETFEEDYRHCEVVLRERGEIVASRPLPFTFDAATEGDDTTPRIKFCFLYAADLEATAISRTLTGYEVTAMPLRLFDSNDEDDSSPRVGSASLPDESPDEMNSTAELVRVPLDELDELVHLVAVLHDETRVQLANHGAANESAMSNELRRRFLGVQERLLRLRMTPIEPRLQEAARAGRVASRARGKQVEWKITGGDVQLDKALAEQLTAPLLHLVRNAVDHGIETLDERCGAGKPERGTISLRAEARGGQVHVLVGDDGRGIEPERVRVAAVARQIISPARQLKGEDHLRLIFRPGFTTAESNDGAAAVSGRGVGLDAAERAVRELGGELRVSSTPGRGTTFEMRLPLTLALLQSIVVRSGKHHYCISAEQVLDAIRFDTNQIIHAADSSHLSWKGKSVSLVHLCSLLDANAKLATTITAAMSSEERLSALILRMNNRGEVDEGDAGKCVALVVDSWEPSEELLTRSLGAHAPQWLGILGAAARPDGTTALLLDIAELMEARK